MQGIIVYSCKAVLLSGLRAADLYAWQVPGGGKWPSVHVHIAIHADIDALAMIWHAPAQTPGSRVDC